MSGDVMDDVYQPMFEPMDRGSLEVIRRLEAYADARLEPTVAATTRIRAAVMAAAHRQAASLAANAAGGTVAITSDAHVAVPRPAAHRPAWLDAVAWRRPAAAILAGCLTLGVLAGTAFAVRPGGLLYEARVWTEAATLPATDAFLARAQAEIRRLGARLDEVEAAASAGDGPALVAALDAYASIASEAAAGTAGDARAEEAVQEALERHMLVLTALAATVPASAQEALQHAIASSAKALDDIGGAPAGPGVTNGSGSGTNEGKDPAVNGKSGSDTGNGAAGAGGSAGDDPAAAPTATPTPAPTATPKPPKPTPTPPSQDRTPRPPATHQPPSQQGGNPSDPPSQDQQ